MQKKDYPIEIGTKQYLLRYNFDSLTAIEDVTGKPFFQSLTDLQTGRLKDLKVIFYAGLKRNHPDVEMDAVGEIIDDCENLQDFLKGVITALNSYFMKSDNAAPAGSKKKPVSTTKMAA